MISAFLFFPRGQGDDELLPDESLYDELETPTENEVIEMAADTVVQPPKVIIVDVKGAVLRPNVYSLQEGQRLIDAITAAGGYTADADSRLLNHAQRLTDEAVIYVPLIGEEMPVFESVISENGNPNEPVSVLININTADETQLMTLTGIGPAKAAAIVKYRTEQGAFQSVEDLMKISGIGQKTFEVLSESITVN
ncbi:helix-hairpin-helix domain-containing protein [Sporosarcina jeotgali]|uniref:Helix-hairpin-helix domain-containing protein n=1 Tax=Sporosarcina jeotgali TaxID=3020056 RepID=A0ABZ0KYM5_9BACL|nr:helix-hairpin-helix domain-containing protein [Sporosarcina sp. B2O-1]WOV85491.1 helix-hairpin-helix domain-containing protein [Sporosarcina sp. B2O-1]